MQSGSGMRYGVLFVCMGNICRSPTAEGMFRKLHAELAPELPLHIDSAGTHSYHVGEPPDSRAQEAARRRGVDIAGHRGRLVTSEDFSRFDYVLAMDQSNLRRLERLQSGHARAKLALFLDYAPHMPVREVPDPYYGGNGGFEVVLDLVEAAGQGLLAELRRRHTRT